MGGKMLKVKLSELVKLHTKALPAIENAMLDVVWTEEEEILLHQIGSQINSWGAEEGMALEKDVPIGLGDSLALIRFGLSLYQLYEDDHDFKLENFKRILSQVNLRIYNEVKTEIFSSNGDDQ